MKKSDVLKQERTAKVDAQNTLIQLAKKEDRQFTTEEATAFDTRDAEIGDLDDQINRAIKAEKIEADVASRSAAAVAGSGADNNDDKSFDEVVRSMDLHKAIRSQIPGQSVSLDGAELEVHQEVSRRARAAGLSVSGLAIPMGMQSRADVQTVGEDSGNFGGATVQTDLRSPIEFLRPTPIVQSLGATVLNGLQGDIEFPFNKGGISATWEGEITEGDKSKNEYGKRGMSPTRLHSTVGISLKNLLQSNFDLQMYTVNEMNRVVAIKLDEAVVNGSGAGNVPLGLINDPDVAVVVLGTNGGAPNWATVVDLESAVMDANYVGARYAYLVNTKTKGFFKKAKHEAGDLGYLMNSANEINGYPVGVSNIVPGNITKGTGTNLSAAAFGDMSQLIIGNWGFMDMIVDNVTRKREAIVEMTLNSFHDVLVRQPDAFAVVKDIDTSL